MRSENPKDTVYLNTVAGAESQPPKEEKHNRKKKISPADAAKKVVQEVTWRPLRNERREKVG
jgi:hypothetical protein